MCEAWKEILVTTIKEYNEIYANSKKETTPLNEWFKTYNIVSNKKYHSVEEYELFHKLMNEQLDEDGAKRLLWNRQIENYFYHEYDLETIKERHKGWIDSFTALIPQKHINMLLCISGDITEKQIKMLIDNLKQKTSITYFCYKIFPPDIEKDKCKLLFVSLS